MPRLIRAPLQQVRSRVFDSERWASYTPRSDDIVIATYSKCGTTWMQRIVSMLVFGTAEPRPIWDLSPWPDMRLFGPIEVAMANAEAQTHRRFFKTHLPYDALPVYEGMKFVHVARDGRDAAMSLHNHLINFRQSTVEALSEISISDPKFGDPYPTTSVDPARYFHEWVSDGGGQGDSLSSFFHVENSYWATRDDKNMLLVHFADLIKDRAGEMRRVAKFLEIEIPDSNWPAIIEAAGFDVMKSQGNELIPAAQALWELGSGQFFNKGTNGRWRDVVSKVDLARYDSLVKEMFTPDLAHWLEHGRLGKSMD